MDSQSRIHPRAQTRFALFQFAALSFFCIFGFSLVMSVALSSLLTRAVSEWEWENTAAFVQREVELSGLDALFGAPRGVETQERWRTELSRQFAGMPEFVRVKVWDTEGTILWSDEPQLIGRRFLDNHDFKEALTGKVAVEIKKLTKAEHDYEQRSFTTLAEVYVPIFSKDTREIIGVLEVYKIPRRLFATIWWGKVIIWTISLAGGLALYFVLLPLVRQVYGRQIREETLRAYARKLEQEVAERTKELEREHEARNHSDKLATMGSLLAGVAHELNNPLSVVMGQALLLRRGIESGPLAERARKILQATERCARIVRNFLSVAHQHPPERQRVSINDVVMEAVELLAYPLRVDNVEVTLELAENLPTLWADPHQLHQVTVNLVSNARQALRGTPPPRRLTLATRYEAGRNRVTLKVTDTGPGIPPEIQARIFEPFFTTKPQGQGTGLGLSICKGIVEAHGGHIQVESHPDDGSVFLLELPIEAPPMPEPDARLAQAPLTVSGLAILVVDDEPMVADLLAEMLSTEGYQVHTATDGIMALHELRERRYDLILSDIKMPRMDGPSLYRQLERWYPEFRRRIIFFTGDTLSPETREFLEQAGAPCIHKPFVLEELWEVIGKVMGLGRPTPAEVARRPGPRAEPAHG